MIYATRKRPRLGWASRIPAQNQRLDAALEAARGDFFEARMVIALPRGEVLAGEIVERGRGLVFNGRAGPAKLSAKAFWAVVETMRRSDGKRA